MTETQTDFDAHGMAAARQEAVSHTAHTRSGPESLQSSHNPGRFVGYAWATGMVVLATAGGALGHGHFFPTAALMLYLIAIGVTAARFGRGPSLFASALSVAASAFFFLPPIFSFAVSDQRHALTFVLMFASALLISGLSLQIQRQGQASRAKDSKTAALYALSRDLVSAQDEQQVSTISARHLAASLGTGAVVLLRDSSGALSIAAAHEVSLPLGLAEMTAAARAVDRKRITGKGTDDVPRAKVTCVPLLSAEEPLGIIAVKATGLGRIGREQRRFLQSFARHTTMALDRARLAEREKVAVLRARTEEMRSSLLSAVSHDLRTPLGAILGAATTLRDEGGAPLEQAQRLELLDSICQETERLAHLVANILEMTRLDAGTVELHREWVPLEEIVGAALTRMEPVLTGRALETELPADLPLVAVDPVLIEQLFVNLLENATKYTPPGSPLDLQARVCGGVVEVEVADRGPGLPKGLESRVLEKFVRGADGVGRGAGLGLAICRGIAEAHGGTMEAMNRPGGGALFRFRLPLVGTPPVMAPENEAGERPPGQHQEIAV